MLFMTYSVSGRVDGVGSQYQKMLNVICFCAKYKYNFFYDFHPDEMDHLEGKCSDPEKECQQVQEFFGLSEMDRKQNIEENKTFDHVETWLSIEEPTPSVDKIKNMIAHLKKWNDSDKKYLVKVGRPYLLGDVDPTIFDNDILSKLYNNLNDTNTVTRIEVEIDRVDIELTGENQSSALPRADIIVDYAPKIVLHARRGDVCKESYYVSELTNISYSRYNSLDEIEQTVKALKKKYQNGIFYLVTEPTTDNEFDELVKKYNIQLLDNLSVVESLKHMIYADVLVLSPSSFSYLCGLYNQNKVYYRPFWHAKIEKWDTIESLGIGITTPPHQEVESFQGYFSQSIWVVPGLVMMAVVLLCGVALYSCYSGKQKRRRKK